MSAEWRPCPNCGWTRGLNCDECEGAGGIRPTAATAALLATYPENERARAFLVLGAALKHPEELAAFLLEWDFLAATGWSLELVPRDPTVASWEPGYIVPGTRRPVKGVDGRFGRLYTVTS